MVSARNIPDVYDPILTEDEAFALFDAQVRRLMCGMSGREFVRRWNAGEYVSIADEPGQRHIMRLGLMIPGGSEAE